MLEKKVLHVRYTEFRDGGYVRNRIVPKFVTNNCGELFNSHM